MLGQRISSHCHLTLSIQCEFSDAIDRKGRSEHFVLSFVSVRRMQVILRRTLHTFPANGGYSSCGLVHTRSLCPPCGQKRPACCTYSQRLLEYASSGEQHFCVAQSICLEYTSLPSHTGSCAYVFIEVSWKEESNGINNGILPIMPFLNPTLSLVTQKSHHPIDTNICHPLYLSSLYINSL